jgi:methylated-DNA-[protein]-cysteine S-methyltransferase
VENLDLSTIHLVEVLVGKKVRNNEAMKELQARLFVDSPIGRIAIGSSEVGVLSIELTVTHPKAEFSDNSLAFSHAKKAADQLASYFSGSRSTFDVPLDIDGTDFQKSVWQQISTIPFGEKLTYGEIAKRIRRPRAARAVGGAVGANPIPILIGCHRVLGSNNLITGYSGGEGLSTKRWLLLHESIGFQE